MNKNIFKKCSILLGIAVLGVASFTSCNEEPDNTNLYASDVLTIEEMLAENENLSAFNAILKRTIYAKTLSTWGNYTCFAPQNEGVSLYLDSLYNDASCDGVVRPYHNGIPETPNFTSLDVMQKIEVLPDSLCTDLAKYHLSGEEHSLIDVSGAVSSWSTMLIGRYITVQLCESGEYKGKTQLGPDAFITSGDNKCSNGILHILTGMIRREDRLMPDQLSTDKNFSIFYEALLATGLDKMLRTEKKDTTYTLAETHPVNRDKQSNPCPTECFVKWTVFAETNDVFAAKGINSFEDLVAYANETYKNCASWYNYVDEKGIQIKTDNNYKDEFNALHMFMAYHILRAGMPVDKIVYEMSPSNDSHGENSWNVCFGYEPQEYFETMLPNTLLKVWALGSAVYNPELRINRWRQNNTLTDEYGTMGNAATHPILREGVKIDRSYNKETLNGYIQKIEDVLVYDKDVVDSQRERLRFDTSTFLYEVINNGIRFARIGEISATYGGQDCSRVAFDVNYFDNIVCYNPNTVLRFCVMGAWRANNSDQFQGWDAYDIAFKLPHVPTGDYELRMIYPPMNRGGLMQFYTGTSSNQKDMIPCGIPFNAYSNPEQDKTFGYEPIDTSDVEGILAADQAMRARGYMRAPASFSRGTYNTITDKLTVPDINDPYSAVKQMTGGTSCRTEAGYGTMMLRRVVATIHINQSDDTWFRIKNLISTDPELGWSFDFMELCPTSVANSQTMMEDWY